MKKFVLSIPFLLLVVLAVVSCKKEETNVGKGGLNSGFLLDSDAVDTFSLITYSKVDDSLLSSNTGTAMLGSYNDPIFGMVESEFYAQFRLSGLSPNFGDLNTIAIDSFVLGLEYKDYYGTLDEQSFEVYELGDDLHKDSIYYKDQVKLVKGNDLIELGKNINEPKPFTSTIIGSEAVDPQLRLFLDTNLARSIMEEATNNPSSFESNENFLSFFKGLNVRVNNLSQSVGKGGILYFNLNEPLSKLTIYYKLAGEAKTFDLLINSESADFNHVTTDNSGTDVEAVLTDKALGEQTFYAQANNARGVIEFPSIDQLPKNAVIQSAKLELPVSYYTGDDYFPSTTISVSTTLSPDNDDLFSIGVTGTYSDFSKSYILDIRDYMQQIVSGEVQNLGLRVAPSKMISSAERIVFNGAKSTLKKQPKLYLIYTTY